MKNVKTNQNNLLGVVLTITSASKEPYMIPVMIVVRKFKIFLVAPIEKNSVKEIVNDD